MPEHTAQDVAASHAEGEFAAALPLDRGGSAACGRGGYDGCGGGAVRLWLRPWLSFVLSRGRRGNRLRFTAGGLGRFWRRRFFDRRLDLDERFRRFEKPLERRPDDEEQ